MPRGLTLACSACFAEEAESEEVRSLAVDIRGIQKGTWQVACRRHLALTVPRALHDRWNGKLQESNQLQRQGNDLPDVSSDVLIPLQLKTSTKHMTWCHRFSLRRALSSGGRKTNNSFLVSPLWPGSILLYRHHPLVSSDSSTVTIGLVKADNRPLKDETTIDIMWAKNVYE